MAVELFEHNAKAYLSAARMMEQTGKAAIVHPTGTGKSFIAFKLIEDHPAARFVWLAPSNYIFTTQKENIAQTTPDLNLSGVVFLTYAKLMQMSPPEVKALVADYIILDEFHRCGAEHWGAGVQALLDANPKAKLLGLSATSIRYLDNQKDMAELLFGGNVASEMSLGEAVVRGILPAPKYVTTVFKYQQDLARYQKRVNNLRSPGIQDVNQKYLDALRRALEQADGLDKIFARHITNKAGKYIVFCRGADHMREMMRQSKKWFARVNKEIHRYVAYSEDPETSRAFAEFKADESAALKLLFCIDMLNEGVHVKGISGVILFRPTISPIIYKQQIGRALTAGENTTPLILDVVNNFEGLSSMDALQEEMQTAIQRMYANGEGDKIITDRFAVEEQVQDCRVLFERLQNSLASSWNQYFLAASEYAAEHGNLNVPKKYVTPGGLSLGTWIIVQRGVRAGTRDGVLTEQQIERLDSIGMVWQNRLEVAWDKGLKEAQAYYAEYGNLRVPATYISPTGYALGRWISQQRIKRANGEMSFLLTEERIAQLDALGMMWDVLTAQWESNYLAATRYYIEHGDLLVPVDYKTEDGFSLGHWIRNVRRARNGTTGAKKPTEEQIRRLDAIGMCWENSNEAQWMSLYQDAVDYYQMHGNLDVPTTYTSPNGAALGKWVARQRCAYLTPERTNSKLTPERVQMLNEIGMVWEKDDPWEHRYKLARDYFQKHGNLKVPAKYKTSDGIWLGRWIYEQKKICTGQHQGKKLEHTKREKLSQLGL